MAHPTQRARLATASWPPPPCWILPVLLVATLAIPAATQTLTSEITPAQTYLGDKATLTAVVGGCSDCPRVVLPPEYGQAFEIQQLGDQHRSSMQILGGRRVEEVTTIYSWRLTPKRAGSVDLPPLTVRAPGGQALESDPGTLVVLAPQEQTDLTLMTRVEPARPVRGRPCRMVLEISMPEALAPRDQLALTIPWAELDDSWAAPDIPRWLQPILADDGSFTINGYTVQTGTFGRRNQTARFELQSREVDGRVVYRLERAATPLATGSIDLGVVTLKGNALGSGRFLASQPLRFEVAEDPARAGQPPLAFVTVRTDPPQAVRGQLVTIVVEVGIRGEGGADPLRAVREPLVLELPWLHLPGELEGAEIGEWLQPLLSPQGRFHVDGTSVDSGSVFRGRQRALLSLPARRESVQPAGSSSAAPYWIYTLERQVTPTSAGTRDLGTAVLKGEIGGQRVFERAAPRSLPVAEVPRAGRPESWCGALGRLQVRASADPTKVRVGDPVQVQLSLGGNVRLESLILPDLTAQLGDDFKVYQPDTGTTENGWKTFELMLRPSHAGVAEVPAIELATYDPSGDPPGYEVVRTQPIALEVEATEELAATEVIASRGAEGARSTRIERSVDGILANHVGARVLSRQHHSPTRVVGFLIALCGVWVVLAFLAARRDRLDPAALRRSGAAKRAEEALRDASEAEDVAAALRGYAADLCDRPEEGLTSREVADLLRGSGAGDELAAEAQTILERCEEARYAGGQAAPDLGADARSLLGRLRTACALILLAVLVGALPHGHAAEVERGAQLLAEADRTFHAARDAEGFERAARLYLEAHANGLANGHVLYNAGNAYARAGAIGHAIACYERARRTIPRDPDVIENLRVCRARTVERLERPASIAARVLFWQPWLGIHEHARLVLLLAVLTFALALVRLQARKFVPAGILLAGVVVTGLTLLAYLDLVRTHSIPHGVLTADEVVPRKGPAASYEPAFQKSLHEGVPVLVRERRGDWLAVELPGGERAWVRESVLETY